MKKKGRICGTIGCILSLALAGGTVVYATMFHGGTVGKQAGLIGSSTGNVVQNWLNTSGYNNTKTLVNDVMNVYAGKEGETYKSYSLSFSYTATGEGQRVTTDGVVYADANYTYTKYTQKVIEDRKVTVSAGEYVLDKKSGAGYMRTNSSPLTETAADQLLLDAAEWQAASSDAATATMSVIAGIPMFFEMVNMDTASENANPVYFGNPGENFFNIVVEGKSVGRCRFTTGFCPTISCSYFSDGMDGTMQVTYSNLNNTKVDVPASATEVAK